MKLPSMYHYYLRAPYKDTFKLGTTPKFLISVSFKGGLKPWGLFCMQSSQQKQLYYSVWNLYVNVGDIREKNHFIKIHVR